jgi:hypothetical protein
MRFHPVKGLATAGAVAAILTAAACSSTSSASSAPPATSAPATSAPAATSTAGGAGGTSSSAQAQIKTNFEKFFATSTPTSVRVTLLQNGAAFSGAIGAFAGSPLASNVSAKVTSVTLTSPTKATVKYDLVAAGQSVASNTAGTAVLENGTWKVGDASFCGLLGQAGSILNIKVPAACKSAG